MANENNFPIRIDWKWSVGIIISLLAVAVPVWITFSQNKTKSLDIKINSITPLLDTQIGQSNDIAITVKGIEVRKPYLAMIEISNSGDIPIEKEDFEKPIEIFVGKNTKLIKAKILKTDPKGISTRLSFDANKILIYPALLNPEDIVTISILTDLEEPRYEASVRISGIKDIVLNKENFKKSKNLMIMFLSISSILCLIGSNISSSIIRKKFIVLNRQSALFTSFLLTGAASISIAQVLEMIGYDSYWQYLAFFIILTLFALPLSDVINRSGNQILIIGDKTPQDS